MKITKGNTSYDIPGWVVFIGLLVVDNAIGNVCRTIISKNESKEATEVVKEQETEVQ